MADIEGGDILITIRGDASQLEAEVGRAQGALDDLEGSAGDAGGAMGSMGSAAGSAGKALQGMTRGGIAGVAAGLGVINPAAGRLVRTLGYLRHVTGPLALAFGAVAVAVKLYTEEQERQNRVAQQNAIIADGLASSQRRLQASIEDLKVATGDLTDEELDLLRVRRQLFAESLPSIQETAAAIFEERSRVEELTRTISAMEEQQRGSVVVAGEFAGSISASAIASTNAVAALENYRSELAESEARIESLTGKQERLLSELEETVKKTADRIEVEQELTRATEAQGDAERIAAKAIRDRTQAEAALQRQRDAQREKARADQAAADDEQEKRDQAKRDKQGGDAEKSIASDRRVSEARLQTLRDVDRASADFSAALEGRNRKAALAAFRINQAASISNIAINTATGMSRQFADLPYPVAIATAAGIAAAGAAQAALVLSQAPPTAHIGTGMPGSRDPLAPDERMRSGRRVLAGEASGPGGVTNTMGTQLINDVNTGRISNSNTRITATIGRSHLDQELFRSGRRGTSRYARQLRTNPHPEPQGGY